MSRKPIKMKVRYWLPVAKFGNPETAFPAFRGEGPLTYVCGFCGFVLMKNIHLHQVLNGDIICGVCQASNIVPGDRDI